jgi:TRAP-type C4-dicarboxylate transport system permease small subunit
VDAFEARLFAGVRWVTTGMLVLTVVLVFGDVLLRYLFASSLGWSEELLRYLLVWMTFLGSYLAVKGNEHLGIQLFFRWLPARGQAPLAVAADLLVLAFFAAFVFLSVQYAAKFFSDPSPTLEIPMGLVYAIMPLAGVLILCQTILNMRQRSRGRPR